MHIISDYLPNTKDVTYDGQRYSVSQWAAILGYWASLWVRSICKCDLYAKIYGTTPATAFFTITKFGQHIQNIAAYSDR